MSLISSSLMIAEVILSSRYLFGVRASKYMSMEQRTPSFLLRHWVIPRIDRRTSATSSSSRMESTLPAFALARALLTFFSPPNDGAPKRAISICASAVWLSSA